MSRRNRRIAVIALVLVDLVIGGLALLPVEVCRDGAFICENTGSRRGNRVPTTGARNRHPGSSDPFPRASPPQPPVLGSMPMT
jgi:hypothetical protein